jgi:diguanylate cyclase (GGDEF)-like protein
LSAFALAFYAEAHTSDQLLYLCFLPVIWLALYYGLAGAAAGIFAVNVGIIGVYWLTGEGGESVLILQVFMLVLAITGLLLGVVVSERRANEHSLRRREAILSAITYAAERFLLESDWRGQMPQVLERLGQAAFASRVYVFENHFGSQGELLTSQRYEWVAPGVTPQIDNPALQNFAYLEGGFERWVEVLGRGEALYGLVRHFPPGEYEVLTAQDILSIAVVPVRVGETWWGFIGFDDCRVERTWEQTEIEALAVAADTLGAAIQRQQTEQELRRRERFLTLLNQITRDALEHHDFHDMVQTLADRLGEIFDADGCYLTHWDEEQQLTFPLAAYGPMRHTYALDQPQPGEVTMTESVLRAGHPLVAENVHQSPYLDPRIAARYPTVSMLALPLIAGEQWLGAALISYHQPHHFTPEEIARGEQVAAQISLAIAKARLFEAERQRTAQLSRANALITALGQVVTRVEGANDLQEVMETLGHELRQLGIHCLLTLLSPDQAYLNLGYLSLEKDQLAQAEQRTGLKFNEIRIPIVAIPLVGQILADGHPRVQHNPEGTALAAFSPYLPRALIRLGMKRLNLNARSTAIYLPLSVEEHIIGLLVVWGAHLQEADLSYLNIFASQVALALEKARLYADLQRLAVTDSLTGCYNRRGLFELGEREVERARRYERPLSLIMMDIDHFKRINDRFGHAAGDLALQALVQRIRGHVREIDLVGRYGGEEFVVLLPESDLPRAAQIAERLRQAIGESSIPTPQGAIDITVSIGVAQADAATKNLEALIGRADRALYAAKQRGRNCVSVEDRHGADLDNG